MRCKILVFFVAATFLFLGTAVFVENAGAETFNLKFSSPWPPAHPQHTMVIEPWYAGDERGARVMKISD